MRVLCILIMILLPATAAAERVVQCYPYKEFVERIISESGEEPVAAGVDHRGNMVQFTLSKSGGFTMFAMVQIEGRSMACPLVWGAGWQMIARPTGQPVGSAR